MFREYTIVPIVPKPVIEGRVPTQWMLDNMHRISREDFYDQSLTEEDLKRIYGNGETRQG